MHLKIVNSYYPIFNKWNRKLVDQLQPHSNGTSIDIFDFLDKATLCMICGKQEYDIDDEKKALQLYLLKHLNEIPDSLFDLRVNVDNEDEFNVLRAVNK